MVRLAVHTQYFSKKQKSMEEIHLGMCLALFTKTKSY